MERHYNGTETIVHDDGSLTNIYYEHEPYTEPLPLKAQLAIIAGVLSAPVLMVGFVAYMEMLEEKREKNKAIARRQTRNKELFHNLSPH